MENDYAADVPLSELMLVMVVDEGQKANVADEADEAMKDGDDVYTDESEDYVFEEKAQDEDEDDDDFDDDDEAFDVDGI